MEELISSASLILAVITFLYTVWYPNIEKAQEFTIDRQYADAKSDHETLKKALYGRAVPLAFASSIMALIFLPVAIGILADSVANIPILPFWRSLRYYDPNSAILLFIEASFIAMSLYLWSLVRGLYKMHQKFEKKRIDYDQRSKSATKRL